MWESGGSRWAAHTPLPYCLQFPQDAPDRPWRPLTFNPPQLLVAEGETATFTCSFSNTSEHFVLNWYRLSPRNQTDKLAAFPEDGSQPSSNRRFRVARLPNGRDFRMSVLEARRNDSGIYLCGAISLSPRTQINESPHAELIVTGAAPPRAGGLGGLRGAVGRALPRPRPQTSVTGSTSGPLILREGQGAGATRDKVRQVSAGLSPEAPQNPERAGQGPESQSPSLCPFSSPERILKQPTEGPSPAPSPAGQLQSLVISITSILVGVLLLLIWVLARRGKARPPRQSEQGGPEAPPSALPTSPSPPSFALFLQCPPQ